MEHLIAFLTSVDMMYVYAAVLVISFIENLFPPFPSDVIVVFAGSLVAMGQGSGVLTVLLATVGSTAGFLAMYRIGAALDVKVIETGRIRFISLDLVHKVEHWFRHYGYWVIVANRFLAGTRAVVSFGAGMSHMHIAPTILLSAVSALAWNIILVYLGVALGENWRDITVYLTTYSKAVSIIIGVALVLWLLRMYILSRRAKKQATSPVEQQED